MKKKERTRKMIIEKASAIFNKKGYSGTSLKDIQEAVGLTKGALYSSFDDKDEIAIAAFEYSVQITYDAISRRTKIIDNTLDKLKAVVYFYKENILNPPVEGGCPILNTSIEADDNNPLLKKKVIKAMEMWKQRIIYTLNKGIEKGEVRKEVDPREFAILFIGTLEGGIMMTRLQRDPEIFNVMAKQLIRNIEELKP